MPVWSRELGYNFFDVGGGIRSLFVLCLLGLLGHIETNSLEMEREKDTLVISFLPPGIKILKRS